jgi:hypothetical protein
MMSRTKIGPFHLKIDVDTWQEGFAHDCLVSGDRKKVGLTFYEIADFNTTAKEVKGKLTAMVWMPRAGAEVLFIQLGEALAQLDRAGVDDVVRIDHTPRKRSSK